MQYLHTMVRVADIDKSLAFYCGLLGLKEMSRHGKREGPLHADLPGRARR